MMAPNARTKQVAHQQAANVIGACSGWKVAWGTTAEVIQQLVDDAPKAREYFSDGWYTGINCGSFSWNIRNGANAS